MELETTSRINNVSALKHHISRLETRLASLEQQLKKDVREVYYSLHLKNMLKNALKEVRYDPGVKSQLISGMVGLGTRLLVEKVLFRKRKGIRGFLITEGLKRMFSHFLLKNRNGFVKKSAN
ncbi:MAG TPA: hypothetical protein VI731_07535 [Bacteroidia bacterium]|nr:hypothetical protein [Bacteroidia bacterium]